MIDIDFLKQRDEILTVALKHVQNLKGKKQDVALFDYLAGACAALYLAGKDHTDCPPWLFVIGVRAGDRVSEAKRMLEESPARPKEAQAEIPQSDDIGLKEPAAKK